MRRRDQLAAAAAAVRRRRRRRPATARHRRRRTTCPASASNLQDHLEVYIQHACTQPVSMQPCDCDVAAAVVGLEWLFRRRAGRHQPLRGRRVRALATTTSTYPNLMFHFLPIAIRYDGSCRRPAGTATRCTSARCTPTRAARCKITSTDPTAHPALRFNYLSTEQDRREWVEAIRVARSILGQPAFDDVQRRRDLAGPGGRDRRADPRLGRAATPRPRCTRRARAGWAPTTMSVVDPLTMGCTARGPARRRRLGDALRHQRQHLRAGDDAGREGRRPDPGQHPTRRRTRRLLPAPVTPFMSGFVGTSVPTNPDMNDCGGFTSRLLLRLGSRRPTSGLLRVRPFRRRRCRPRSDSAGRSSAGTSG